MWHLLTEVVVEQPETIGFLKEFLDSAFAQISAFGLSGIAGITLLLGKYLPSKNFTQNVTDKLFKIEDTLKSEISKLQELELAQKEYQDTTDELMKEIALHSPNAKVKELGKKLEEKKQALSIQQTIQDKITERTKEIKAQVVSVLKKSEVAKED
jgi:seryl-tRNA synthetase